MVELRKVPSRARMQKNAEHRATYRVAGLGVGSFSTSFTKAKATAREKFVRAGKHSVYLHSNGYPLASSRLIEEIQPGGLCMQMLNVPEVNLDDILLYKGVVENGRNKLTSKIMNTYKQAMISISEGKLHILSLPSKRGGGLGVGRSKRAATKNFKLSRRRMSNASDNSLRSSATFATGAGTPGTPPFPSRKISKLSDINSSNLNSSKRNTRAGMGLGGMSRENSFLAGEDDGAAISLCLSHIYDIDMVKPNERSFSVTFYCPQNDTDIPPTDNYQLVYLAFKADTPEKAVAWVKHILAGVESSNKVVATFIDRMRKDKNEKGVEDEALHARRMCDLMRLNVDLWSIVKGFWSKEVSVAMNNLVDFLKETGDIEEESSFWKEQIEKVESELEKASDSSDLVTNYIDVVRQDYTANGLL